MDRRLHFPMECSIDMHFYSSLAGKAGPPYNYPHHIESEVELFILVEGDVSFAVESRVYRMSPGDIILTKPNEMHHCIRNSTTVNDHYCFYFKPSPIGIFEDFLKHNFGCNNLISPVGDDRALILGLAKQIDEGTEGGADRLELLSSVLQMLATVRRNMGKYSTPETLPEPLEIVLAEMDEHLSESLTIESVCEKHFISYSTLSRLFRRHLDTTPRAYLESKRLANARRMLESGVSVGETCRAIGFSDTSSFIRLFKQRFGETPLKYGQK